MEKFYYGMMQNGGQQSANQMMSDMQQRGQQNDYETRKQIQQSMPMGSGMSRAMAGELSQNALNRNLQMQQIEQQLQNQAMQRQFQGAQGLQGAAQYYRQPSSIELAMLGAQRPYDLANLQAQSQQQQGIDQMMTQLGMYQPERQTSPSQFEQIWGPLINAGGSIAGAAMMGGGG